MKAATLRLRLEISRCEHRLARLRGILERRTRKDADMTTAAIREAAERRRAWRAWAKSDDELAQDPYADRNRRRLEDAALLADAYLALASPPPAGGAGDDDVAVDEAWLRSVGSQQIDSIARHWVIATDRRKFDVYYFPNDDSLRLYTANLDCDGKTSSGGCHIVTEHPTRGRVRQLCVALGIELTHDRAADALRRRGGA